WSSDVCSSDLASCTLTSVPCGPRPVNGTDGWQRAARDNLPLVADPSQRYPKHWVLVRIYIRDVDFPHRFGNRRHRRLYGAEVLVTLAELEPPRCLVSLCGRPGPTVRRCSARSDLVDEPPVLTRCGKH